MQELSLQDIEYIVKTMAETAVTNEKYFSDLDAAAGDADFGVSLAGGFRKVLEQWDSLDHSAISPFLLKVSMIISGNVGGCSGPIWGTAFMRSGMVARGKESLTLADVVEMLQSAIEGIMARGGASLGDKTLLDVLDPITNTLAAHSQAAEPGVLTALKEKRIAGGAFDVYGKSPLQPDSPYLKLDNVVLTPHIGGATVDVITNHSRMAFEDIVAFMGGKTPAHAVNPEVIS